MFKITFGIKKIPKEKTVEAETNFENKNLLVFLLNGNFVVI